ncbi:hypothetical protein D187_000804 [Cystobacter fuscus DSM 2262]|uniref:LysM domain-containing protein n=1 Tax=Cystobacter fuscus (strain ATCC 25194 / DSM 2262 / NBRC 100088 / M29) TaxID=1242864 RepID=S9R8E7_CYSF2|nr:LysM peptidoglycan-binding domain-containing protein [Cystobacter fuscus]EPX65378.1 hypothetical protein D187_000804 [Cystobacter fuscus DSM 2262]
MTPSEYKVKPGDTLSAIARHHHVTVDDIAHVNGIKDVNRIRVGQSLRIPVKSTPAAPSAPMAPPPARTLPPLPSSVRPRTHRVRLSETLPQIAQRYGLSASELAKANGLADPRLLWVGQELNIPPASAAPPPASAPPHPANETAPTSAQSSPPKASSPPSANAIREVAFRVTGSFEGGKASTYQTKDKGIVSYGKHQATLASGTLGTIITQYVQQSSSEAAKGLARYKDKISKKDTSLRTDATFKKLLLEAATDPLMSTIQDSVFAQNYWPTAEQSAKKDKLKTPLALIMYYDTNIQGGLSSVREKTLAALKGKSYTEAEFLSEFNHQRKARLTRLAKDARDEGNEDHARMLEGSRSRVTALQTLVDAKDFQLRGDPHGMLTLNDHKVRGLGSSSATASSSSGSSASSSAKGPSGNQRTLTGSVGTGGHNADADVRLVQTLLNAHRLPPRTMLPVNGRVDPQLVGAITEFQRSMGMQNPDGRVDPGGGTFKALCAGRGASVTSKQPNPWDVSLPIGPSGGGNSAPAHGPTSSTQGHTATLAKLAKAARQRFKLKNLGACARGVSELLQAAGYTYAGSRPRVADGIIKNQAYDYSTGTWVSGTTTGYYVSSRSAIGEGGRVVPGKQKSAAANVSAKFFAHTLRMLGFADCTKCLPGNGKSGAVAPESVKALRALPDGAVIVFGPALNRSVQKTGGHYTVGGHGHAGHVGVLVHEGEEALVVADGLLAKGGVRYTVESCLSNYAWAIGFVPTTAGKALTAKDQPKSSLL